jgi:hypothetical protein
VQETQNVALTVFLEIIWQLNQVNANVVTIAVTQLFKLAVGQECLAVLVAEQQLQQNKSAKVAGLIQT